MLILQETYDDWSVAVLTVTVHSSFFDTFDFLKICCFLHWIQPVNPHFSVTLYYNASLYILERTKVERYDIVRVWTGPRALAYDYFDKY